MPIFTALAKIQITMSNQNTDPLFQLIQSLSKSEKRNFKLFINRHNAKENLKIVTLFDAIDKQKTYDEKSLLQKNKALNKQQIHNLKAHLHRQILSSLRLLPNELQVELSLNEQFQNAQILYNKGLYLHSLKLIYKIKELAKWGEQLTYLQQAIFFEKKIESQYITRSLKNKADEIANESTLIQTHIQHVSQLSNLALQLYGWYIKNGFASNKKEALEVTTFLNKNLPHQHHLLTHFYEKMYLYQSICWKAFIVQDLILHYRYAQKWVDLFWKKPHLMPIESIHYIKGLYNLMSAYFYLGIADKLAYALKKLNEFQNTAIVQQNQNNTIQCFIYYTIAQLNYHFLIGDYNTGLKSVKNILLKLDEYDAYIDVHRVGIIHYKIACMYFGASNYDVAIDYLNKIINSKSTLRADIQCYARLLHLIAHYEIGNFNLLEYLVKSVYRFMGKMQNLSVVEEMLFLFLRKAIKSEGKKLMPLFKDLLAQLLSIKNKPFETRALMYLDVISWLQSKIEHKPITTIVQQKNKLRNKT